MTLFSLVAIGYLELLVTHTVQYLIGPWAISGSTFETFTLRKVWKPRQSALKRYKVSSLCVVFPQCSTLSCAQVLFTACRFTRWPATYFHGVFHVSILYLLTLTKPLRVLWPPRFSCWSRCMSCSSNVLENLHLLALIQSKHKFFAMIW